MFAILKKHSPKLTEDSFEFQLKYRSDDTDYTVFAVWQILLNIVHPFLMEMHVFLSFVLIAKIVYRMNVNEQNMADDVTHRI